MNTEFQWTDALAKEYAEQYRFSSSRITVEQFKEGKRLVKPEWEILSYLSNTQPDQYVISKSDPGWNYAVVRDHLIHSVKRLSDNTIWSLGDKFLSNAGTILTIKKLEIEGSNIKVSSKEYGYWLLDAIKKIPLAKEGKVIVSTAALYKFLSEKMEFWKDEVKIYGADDELIIDGFKGLIVHCQRPFECIIEISRIRQLKRLLGAITDQPITLIIDGFKFEIQHICI